MYTNHRKRGSALMLTIGLLAILVMLGTTFLLVSHLNAKSSRAVITRNQSSQVAGGVVMRLTEMLKNDLHIGNNGPYSRAGLDTEAIPVLAYGEFARPMDDDAWWTLSARPDLYLSHTDESKRLFSLLHSLDPNESATAIDVDADGSDDAWLRKSQSVSSTGEQYWMAVKVIDLAGRACINTGGTISPHKVDDPPPSDVVIPAAATLYDLEGILGTAAYRRIHMARTDVDNWLAAPNLLEYYVRGASRLLKPLEKSYQPFAVSDEMYLRYYENKAMTETGRLVDELDGAGVNLSNTARSLLTTYSCSRRLMRRPQLRGDAPLTIDLSTEEKRKDVNTQIRRLLYSIEYGKNDTQRDRLAACLTANLWAYSSKGETDAPWKFTSGDLTAWGLKQRLVITEAYASHKPESAPNADDHIAGFAIEVLNPTGETINLNEYQIVVGSDDVDLPAKAIGAGKKAVLYSFVEGGSYTGNKTDREDDTGLDTTGWFEVDDPKLRFDQSDAIQLFRGEVIVDQVSGDDLEYAGTDIRTDPEVTKCIRRDDNLDRARYNLAVYKAYTADKTHRLGEDNNLTSEDLKDSDALNSVPIVDVGNFGQNEMRSLAEMARVYMTGPQKEGSTHTPFSKTILSEDRDAVDFKDIPGRGRSSFYPTDIAVQPNTYPRVPLGCLLGEFFAMHQGDLTRTDDDRRAYGLININTAPRAVLENLPWPESVTMDGKSFAVSPSDIAQAILDYRAAQRATHETYMPDLRKDQPLEGFRTPGELAVPLAHYMSTRLGWDPSTTDPSSNAAVRTLVQHPDFIAARDELYNAVANLVTVRSDTFAAIIHVQVGEDVPAKNAWKYLAIIDRSNCNDSEDEPAVLVFTPLK
ncbi:MAG: hypothetical protein ACOCXY_00095 [Planctomycetota bacterium]